MKKGLPKKHHTVKKSVTSYDEIKSIMRLILDDENLEVVLSKIANHIEEKLPKVRASVFLFDQKNQSLHIGAAPSFPDSYKQLVNGIKIGPKVATCGTAAYTRSIIVVRDTYTDPLWNDYLAMAQAYKIRACWSIPILNMKNDLMGTFAVYREKTHKPSQKEIIIVRELVDIVCLAIERSQSLQLKKQNEEEMERQRVNAVNSLKYASLGEMAGNIAHEINSPLAVISGSIHQLNRITENEDIHPEKLKIYTERLNRSVSRIEKIIKGMRSITRDSSNDLFVKISAQRIIEDVVTICGERLKNSGIILSLTGDLDVVLECRSIQISQVILNLINNSFEAIGKNSEGWIEIHTSSNDGYVRFEIEDSGEGIADEIVDKIMTPLFTTKIHSKATGLGLSISHAFIEEHSGKIWYDKEGKHTRFVIELPVEQVSSLKLKQAA